MRSGRVEDTIYGLHLVNPDRVVVPAPAKRAVVPHPKPFDAPPGVRPFHRALEAQNIAEPRDIRSGVESGHDLAPVTRPGDRGEVSWHARLMPTLGVKIGEILPVIPDAPIVIEIEESRQVHTPATGRSIDLYI